MADGTVLEDLLSGHEILVVPGAHDPLTARLAERAGFSAVFVGGSAVTNSRLGLPDHEFLSLPELASVCRSIRETSSALPIVDADTGYGDDVNVRRTMQVLEAAGAAAVVIEDQVSPKRSGHVTGKQIVTVAEMCRKIDAAARSRSDDQTLVIARTDARLVEGLDAAIDRSNKYASAGADVIFVESPLSTDEMAQITTSVPGPRHLINMGGSGRKRTTPKVALAELQQCGYQLAIFALQPLRAAALGTWQFLQHLASEGIEGDRALLNDLRETPFEDWYEFTGLNELLRSDDPADFDTK
jgi:2-methylisocitrate lyase-like PEP mutase family enzyme